jgi:DNA polymerase-4
MDSFFVEVERLDRPDLAGRPVAVGGAGPRGVIASASYEARSHGVRSAQPTSTARRLCPELIVVPPSHGRYADLSADVFSIFRSITPVVEGLSLDEAFLDVRGLRLHFDSPVAVGQEVRSRLRSELRLPASVGVAAVKFVAKLASEQAKPDGLFHVSAARQHQFLETLPASAMWGVGPATMAALTRLGVETVGDIATLPRAAVVGALGPSAGGHLHDLANGIDPRDVVPDTKAKSISVEETYDVDLANGEVVETALLAHAQQLSGRLRRSGLRARTVTLKVRYPDFTTVSRSLTVNAPVDGARQLFKLGRDLLSTLDDPRPVRLLGLGGTSLEPSDRPAQLEIGSEAGWDRVEDAVAEVRARFGDDSVGPARLRPRSGTPTTDAEP